MMDLNKIVKLHGFGHWGHAAQYFIMDHFPHALRLLHPVHGAIHLHHPNSSYAAALAKWSNPDE